MELKGNGCRSRLAVREVKRAKTKDTPLGAEVVFSAMPPSEGLKMLISCALTDSDGLREPVDGRMGRVSSTLVRQESRRVYTTRESWHDWNEACVEGKTLLRSGATRGPRNLSRQTSTWGRRLQDLNPEPRRIRNSQTDVRMAFASRQWSFDRHAGGPGDSARNLVTWISTWLSAYFTVTPRVPFFDVSV